MNIVGFSLLVAAFVIAGVLLIIAGLRGLFRWKSVFDSSLVVEMSCAQGAQPFQIPADGDYDIWIKGPRFRVNPLIDREPRVRPAGGGASLPLTPSIFRTNMTRGATNVMKTGFFTARRGAYVLDLVSPAEAGSRSGLVGFALSVERAVARRIPLNRSAPADCFLQVRPRSSNAWLFKGVLSIVFGAILLVGAVVAGVLLPALARAETPDCDSTQLGRLSGALALSADRTLPEMEEELGVLATPSAEQSAGEPLEFLATPLSGSVYADLIDRMELRLNPAGDGLDVVAVTVRPDTCHSMSSVVQGFGQALEVGVSPHQSDTTMTLRYPFDDQIIVFGFGAQPGYRLVSITLGQSPVPGR